MKVKRKKRLNTQGFTMIELLLAMAISLLAIGAIYSTFLSQFKSYQIQEEVAAMQQNIRAAMFHLQREIRMAGYDPTGNAGAAIMIANVAELQFTIDKNGNSYLTNPGPPPVNDSNEQIRYALTNDVNRDGIADGSPCNLGRAIWGGGLQIVAENIDALNFVYLDADGTPTATLSEIRSVEITIVARTGRSLRASPNNMVYKNQQGAQILDAQNDNFSRRRLAVFINCRNLGQN
jgi:type IV pilus assembly protein PilW